MTSSGAPDLQLCCKHISLKGMGKKNFVDIFWSITNGKLLVLYATFTKHCFNYKICTNVLIYRAEKEEHRKMQSQFTDKKHHAFFSLCDRWTSWEKVLIKNAKKLLLNQVAHFWQFLNNNKLIESCYNCCSFCYSCCCIAFATMFKINFFVSLLKKMKVITGITNLSACC